ncbi:MAG: hypothetical protein PHN33_01560 [Candidatus Peribacteraceae bacterium]|nr:hypothetical protein [Candidatus Peribacteraceae bacterium]
MPLHHSSISSEETDKLATAFDTIEKAILSSPKGIEQQCLAEMLADIQIQMGGILAPELDEATKQQFQQWSKKVSETGGVLGLLEHLHLSLRIARAIAARSAPLSVPPESLALFVCRTVCKLWLRFENHNSSRARDEHTGIQADALARLIEKILPYLPEGDERRSVLEKVTMLKRIAQGEAIRTVLEDTLKARAKDPAPALADG